MIPGKYGRIEYHDGHTLAVYGTSMRLLGKLLAAGAMNHQMGDGEYRLLFDPALLPAIARVMKAHRRPVLAA